jgi:hypothetical protein
MAGTSLLALLDDIASVLDDVSLMTRMAAKKTAGVLGDDLALNAQQVAGVHAERELPVVFAVAKGSIKNKAILVPAALVISALAPWAITPLLMVGGAYLCFEGFEKISHALFHRSNNPASHDETLKALSNPDVDIVAFEREKIKGAIRTDFILSAEIIVIALGTVKEASFGIQLAVLSGVALLMTVGVYALVAAIVKMDDGGLYLLKSVTVLDYRGRFKRALGVALLRTAPYLMKTLSIVGTVAMFMVGGGILVHGMPHTHEVLDKAAHAVEVLPFLGAFFAAITPTVLNAIAGIVAGGIVLAVVSAGSSVIGRFRTKKSG